MCVCVCVRVCVSVREGGGGVQGCASGAGSRTANARVLVYRDGLHIPNGCQRVGRGDAHVRAQHQRRGENAPQGKLGAALGVCDALHAGAEHVGVIPRANARARDARAGGRRARVDHRVVKIRQDAVKGNLPGRANVARVAEQVGHLGRPVPRPLFAPVARVKRNGAVSGGLRRGDGVARRAIQLVRGFIVTRGVAKVGFDHVVAPLRVRERVERPVAGGGHARPGAAALVARARDGLYVRVNARLEALAVKVRGEVREAVREHLDVGLHNVRHGVARALWHDALLHKHVLVSL